MKSAIRQLPRVLDMHQVGLQDRSYVLSLGLARAIAYSLPIPTSPVEIPLGFFALQCLDSVNATLSDVNEQCVINVDLAVSLTKKIWLLRYNLVFDMDNAAVRDLVDGVIAGRTGEIPPNAGELCRKYENQGLFSNIADTLKTALSGEALA